MEMKTEKTTSATILLTDKYGITITLKRNADGNLEIVRSDSPGDSVVYSPELLEKLLVL